MRRVARRRILGTVDRERRSSNVETPDVDRDGNAPKEDAMFPHPETVFMLKNFEIQEAQSYAARARLAREAKRANQRPNRLRLAVGGGLVRFGRRLQGTPSAPAMIPAGASVA
jgi:hypothetical protein